MANYNITPCSGSTSIVVDFQSYSPVVSKVYYIYFTGLTAPSCYTVNSVTGATAVEGVSSISNANDDCFACTGCTCHYVNVTIVQSELDAASGNTDPSLNGVVSVQYTRCDNNPSYSDYTVAGTYLDDLCLLKSQIYTGTNIIYYYQDDTLITSSYPYTGSSVFDTGSCCVDPTPTPTPTVTNTLTPTVTPTNTLTPTVTPTNTLTPSVTPSNTSSPLPFDIYTFRECCDNTNIFRFSFVPGSMTVGQVFFGVTVGVRVLVGVTVGV